jgi:hypothetical protein
MSRDAILRGFLSGLICALASSPLWACGGTSPGVPRPSATHQGHVPAPLVDCEHSSCCAAGPDGTACCWGASSPITTTADHTCMKPRCVHLGGPVSSIAAASWHACAVVEGQVFCWGRNDHGQTGPNGGGPSPALVPLPWPAHTVVARSFSSCAISASHGEVLCWGQEILPGPQDLHAFRPTPRRPASGPMSSRVLSLSMHAGTGCAMLRGNEIVCFGEIHLQSIDGRGQETLSSTSLGLGGSDIVNVVVGHGSICVLTRGGHLYCWGRQPWSRKEFSCAYDEGCSKAPLLVGEGVRDVLLGDGWRCHQMSNQRWICYGEEELSSLIEAGLNGDVEREQANNLASYSDVVCRAHTNGDVICLGEFYLGCGTQSWVRVLNFGSLSDPIEVGLSERPR